MKKHFAKKAFSLVELSVVILIVGILFVGVIKGNRMINASKLLQAQALTKAAPVNSIPDLVLWLESTLDGSITGASTNNSLSNGDLISSWNDILSGSKFSITQSTPTNQPFYVVNGIGGLPSLGFDGADFLSSTTSVPILPGDDSFTFVAVWYRSDPASSACRVVFEQNNNGTLAQGRRAAFLTCNASVYGFNGESNDYHSNSYAGGIPYISHIVLTAPTGSGTTITVNIYSNSNTATYTGTINAGTENVANNIFCIGVKCITSKGEYFLGNLSEIMVFDRNLMPSEVALINSYLSKKYNITVN